MITLVEAARRPANKTYELCEFVPLFSEKSVTHRLCMSRVVLVVYKGRSFCTIRRPSRMQTAAGGDRTSGLGTTTALALSHIAAGEYYFNTAIFYVCLRNLNNFMTKFRMIKFFQNSCSIRRECAACSNFSHQK